MSPTGRPGFQTAACVVCRGALRGQLVACGACGAYVHSHCSVGLMQDSICENCFGNWQAAEEQRQQHQSAARRLGYAGARGSEIIGTAFGAVGAASVAATRYLVAGASAGARSAWQGSTVVPPPAGLEVTMPRPASLPAPLPIDPAPTAAACASEGAERRYQERERERERKEQERQNK